MFGAKVFRVGWCNASCLEFLTATINCFWKIWVVLKRTFKSLIAVFLKRTDCRLGSGSTVTAVWRWLTSEEAEAGLVDADVPAVRQWWLEENGWVTSWVPPISVAFCKIFSCALYNSPLTFISRLLLGSLTFILLFEWLGRHVKI